jgi:hypothetical protein
MPSGWMFNKKIFIHRSKPILLVIWNLSFPFLGASVGTISLGNKMVYITTHFLKFNKIWFITIIRHIKMLSVKDTKNHENKRLKERFKFISKQGSKQDYVIQNMNKWTKNKNMKCAKQTWKWIFIMLTYANMNMRKTWQGYGAEIMPKISVEQTERNEGSCSYLCPFGELTQGSFEKGFYVCIM